MPIHHIDVQDESSLRDIVDSAGATHANAPLTNHSEWKTLVEHHATMINRPLSVLFADDPRRGETFNAEGAGLYLDYSKNHINHETRRLLIELADCCELRKCIDAMFRGDKINLTENRSVLHTALRAPAGTRIVVDGIDVVAEVHVMLDRMATFTDQVRKRPMVGTHRSAHSKHRKYRHRWF